MKKVVVFLVGLGLVIGGSGLAQAVVLTPADLTPQNSVTATTKYAWDWDMPAPIGSSTVGGAPGFGDSAWYSDVSGSASAVSDNGRDYTSFRLFTDGIFGGPVTVGQLSNISYWTNWVGGNVDWRVNIYTKPTGATGWYDSRIQYNYPTGVAGGGWENWDINSLGVAARTNRPSLILEANQEIMFIDILASYATNSPPSYTYLDGVEISLAGGRSHVMDLQAVPEPATVLLLGIALVGFLGARRRLN